MSFFKCFNYGNQWSASEPEFSLITLKKKNVEKWGLFERGEYFKYFGQSEVIIRGSWLIGERLLFEEVREYYK